MPDYSVRDALLHHEAQTPTHCNSVVDEYHHRLNAYGRAQPYGHRTEVTAAVALSTLRSALEGEQGLAPRLVAFRRVQALKPKPISHWTKAATDLLADSAQREDPKLERSRAERIVATAVPKAVTMLMGWLG